MAQTPEERKAAHHEAAKRYREKHRDRVREAQHKWCEANPNRVKNTIRTWNKAHPEQVRASSRKWYESHTDHVRERIYGISSEAYEQLLTQQRGVCVICGKEKRGRNVCLSVDHDHATGKIRGLLCQQCNAGLGHFADNPDWLRKAAEYLEANR